MSNLHWNVKSKTIQKGQLPCANKQDVTDRENRRKFYRKSDIITATGDSCADVERWNFSQNAIKKNSKY